MPKKRTKKNRVAILLKGKNLLEKKDEIENFEEPSYTITEGNLFYRHFASLGTTSKERKKLVSEVVEEKTADTGARQVKRWKVKGDVELGYPTWLDEKVFIGVIDIARRLNYPVQNPIEINISELCRTTGLNPKHGRNRDMVRASLQRIALTRIEAKDAFYYKEQEAFVDYAFSIFQDVVFAKLKIKDEKASNTLVWLSDRVLSNINRGYVRLIDTKLFMKLTPIAGRLYELLSNRFFGLLSALRDKGKSRKDTYVTETYEELCARLPLRSYQKRSRAIQQFANAHKQLLDTGFLEQVEWLEDNTIRYYPGTKACYDFDNALREISRQIDLPFYRIDKIPLQIEGKTGEKSQRTLELVPEGMEPLLNQEMPAEGQISPSGAILEAHGVSKGQARALAAEFDGRMVEWGRGRFPLLEFYCQYYDWMLKRSDEKKPLSGAWLVKAIREGWLPPNDFKTKEQLEETKRRRQKEVEQHQEIEKRQREEEDQRYYQEWLKKTPEQRWEAERFSFQVEFRRKHDRLPNPQEEARARKKYLAHPETPEQYQKRHFEKVIFPLTS